jgi:hypothetical protein
MSSRNSGPDRGAQTLKVNPVGQISLARPPSSDPGITAARLLLTALFLLHSLPAQQPLKSPIPTQALTQGQAISGLVTDPSGAIVVGATVALLPPHADANSSPLETTWTGPNGRYTLHVPSGAYTLSVQSAGFARFDSLPVDLPPHTELTLDIRLKLEVQLQQIDVNDDAATPASRSGSSIVLTSHDIETMPLDSAALLAELQGLAGSPDAALYVDGFSNATLPPRSSIREVRINQNPYSAQNDTNPVNGTIQVTTKPGTDHTHGQFYLYGDESALNAANPFSPRQPGYYAFASGGSLSGPLNHRASYLASWDQTSLRMNSAIDAQTLDANLLPTQLDQAVPSPRSLLNISSKLDLRTGQNSTLMLRYIFDRSAQTNGGVGQLNLISQGFDNSTDTQTLQAVDTRTLGSSIVDETRLQYARTRAAQTPNSLAPTVIVEGAFTGGGNNQGVFSDHQDRLELQNYLSLAKGNHYLNLGGRFRLGRDANHSLANYNGEFIFSTLTTYQLTLAQLDSGSSMDQVVAAGGGASQFNLNAGIPDAAVTLFDGALFLQDDWKLKPTLTLSYGLRFESQTYIHDHADYAPRFGFSWSFGHKRNSAPRYVLRGGAGIFYKRFTTDSALLAERQDGITQQEYVVNFPDFYATIPSIATLGVQDPPAIYRVAPNFHSPYFIGETIGLDRQLGRFGTVNVTYLYNRGVRNQLTENVNAPLPGTYNPSNPSSAVRPWGGTQNIYEFVSEGVYRSNRVSTNLTVRAGSWLTLFGYYMLRFDNNDSSGGTFPSNQYNLGADYGRSDGDIRHTVNLGGNTNLAHGIHASGYIRALSGAPFNIVVGQDLNGDTQFNDRPAFATDLTRPSVITTRYGAFDTSPTATQTIIPRNYAQGPAFVAVNLALGKSFRVGPELKTAATGLSPAKSAQRKYTVDLWAESQNLLNHRNLAPPIGTLNSPLFGRSIAVTGPSALSADRIVDLQMSLRF